MHAKAFWQTVATGGWQAPLAQVDWATTLSVPEQLGPEPQFVVGYEQVPSALPAQAPPHVVSVPQDARFPWGGPEATALQMPRNPRMSQAMHGLSQVLSQQMPSGAQIVPARQPLAPVC